MKKLAILLITVLPFMAIAEGEKTKQVFISPGVISIDVVHNGKTIKLLF